MPVGIWEAVPKECSVTASKITKWRNKSQKNDVEKRVANLSFQSEASFYASAPSISFSRLPVGSSCGPYLFKCPVPIICLKI